MSQGEIHLAQDPTWRELQQYFSVFKLVSDFPDFNALKYPAGRNKEIEMLRNHISSIWGPRKEKKSFLESPDLKEIAFTVDYNTSINNHDSIWGGFKSI